MQLRILFFVKKKNSLFFYSCRLSDLIVHDMLKKKTTKNEHKTTPRVQIVTSQDNARTRRSILLDDTFIFCTN